MMKRFLTLCTLFHFLLLSEMLAQTEPFFSKQTLVGKEVYINAERVRLREGPGLNAKIITNLGYGIAGIVLEVSAESVVDGQTNRWCRIQLSYGAVGWVWGQYVSVQPDSEISGIKLLNETVLTQNDLDVYGYSDLQSISQIMPHLENPDRINKIMINASCLKTLEGFEAFKNLSQLFLYNAKISSCQELKDCIKLSDLRFINSKLESLNGIYEMEISHLSLEGSTVENLESVAFPVTLESLVLENFKEYAYLIRILPDTVKTLYLGYNGITSMEQITALKSKPNLYELSFPGNSLKEDEYKKIFEWGNIQLFYTSSD